jgi:methylamine---glutamate N-methyltransferase subunit A
MCGIVGLFLKSRALEPRLGAMLSQMLGVMTDRGPDSAGFAVYGAGDNGHIKLTLRADRGDGVDQVAADLSKHLGRTLVSSKRGSHVVLTVPKDVEQQVREWLAANRPDVRVVGAGCRMELYKEVGLPSDVAERFALKNMAGTHGIGHTRMATESAVTTDGAHPFSTGIDQCLVHNGSLSNHNGVRRTLQRDGLSFQTENDTEVAAAYLTWRLRQGMDLESALDACLSDLDGFYTFVVGTESGFAVLRDPIACKPAVMAETDDYVAFGTEYRALVGLPGVDKARVFEPEPAKVYVWERH